MPADFERLPPHKTLFKTQPGCGLPIGNLTSQFFANVYLDPLDQFVKHQLKARYYLRYCDDLVLLSADQAQLADWERQIEAFLAERLRLQLNERRQLHPVADGIDFLGHVLARYTVLMPHSGGGPGGTYEHYAVRESAHARTRPIQTCRGSSSPSCTNWIRKALMTPSRTALAGTSV